MEDFVEDHLETIMYMVDQVIDIDFDPRGINKFIYCYLIFTDSIGEF